MLEEILALGKRRLFIEKLFALEKGKEAVQFLFRLGDDLTDQAHKELAADHCQLLQQRFLVWREAVNAGGQYTLHRGRNTEVGREGQGASYPYSVAHEHPLFH